MSSDLSVFLHLSVWRPARLHRQINYSFAESTPGVPGGFFDPERLQEQIYAWDPGPNDVLALPVELSTKFKPALMEDFAPDLLPEQRKMEHFSATIDMLDAELRRSGSSYWGDSQEVEFIAGDMVNLRYNAGLALLHHLRWICKTFEHVPGASVVIR